MTELTWQDRKRIGEALGWSVPDPGETRVGYKIAPAWDAYQPDVLGEVIPWLEREPETLIEMVKSWHPDKWRGSWWRKGNERVYGEGDTFSEAVCALMLAVIAAGVPA